MIDVERAGGAAETLDRPVPPGVAGGRDMRSVRHGDNPVRPRRVGLILGEAITTQMAVAGAAVLVSVAVILRSGGTSVEPGRGLFTRQRPIAAAAATEPTA